VKRAVVSPAGLAIAAVIIAVAFGVAHALGLRPYTAVLSGTAPPGASGGAAIALGLAYVALYFAFVIVAPILLIAAGVMRLVTRRSSPARDARGAP
jgi:hypothetical protein